MKWDVDKEITYTGFIYSLNDIIMLSFYFIELFPSIIIIIVLWKSNLELKYKQLNDSSNKRTSSNNEEENIRSCLKEQKSDNFSRLHMQSSNNLSGLR